MDDLVSRIVGLLLCGAGDRGSLPTRLQVSKTISDAWTACRGAAGALCNKSSSLDAGGPLHLPICIHPDQLSGQVYTSLCL